MLQSDVEFIQLIGEDLMKAGGKRVRPSVCLLAAQALGARPGGPEWNQVLDLAACTELLHSASLLHDDLIDDADTRRGQPTAFRRFGNVVSVMSGDFMLSRLLARLSTLPASAELTRAFGETAGLVCEGEVLQFQVAAYGDYSTENYLRIIHGKTAALLELAARAPALLLGQPAIEPALATFGREYGMAFQMRDDLLDLGGDPQQLGKPAGSDLREGKATGPVLALLDTEYAPEIRQILERQAAQPGDTERVLVLAQQTGALERTAAEISRRLDLARAALEALPPSPARSALAELAGRAGERNF
ncbi:polyprenyl synthetase family protein [Deinococcus lacus]|uniref:Polyprenyl synthetase family protein n=1 Tax=Deinococcus lacus TaxID=392561 RepID=A0ABW1YFC8_9DEIO